MREKRQHRNTVGTPRGRSSPGSPSRVWYAGQGTSKVDETVGGMHRCMLNMAPSPPGAVQGHSVT